jgi:hypothetical protein
MSAVVMMLYTSGVMKSNSNIVEFFITWENQSLLQALGAQYSEDFGGLPRISKRVPTRMLRKSGYSIQKKLSLLVHCQQRHLQRQFQL